MWLFWPVILVLKFNVKHLYEDVDVLVFLDLVGVNLYRYGIKKVSVLWFAVPSDNI